MSKLNTKVKIENSFRDQLHEAGYKATPARLAILNVLHQAKKPLNIQQIMSRLGNNKIDQATVYRNINSLKDSDLILHIDFQHAHAFYELAAKGDHHHVVCLKCDRVEDVHHCEMEKMTRKALKQSNFSSISNHSLEFFGICKKCQI